jgi:hypothetical protein
MSKKKTAGIFKRLLSLVLVSAMLFGSSLSAGAASKDPKYNCAKTKKNVLKLLDAYDPEGAYIIRSDKSGMLMTWFEDYNTRGEKLYLCDCMDTAVHESFHKISVGYTGDNMYIGNKKFVYVSRTKVFSSTKASKKIPKRLRTFRFDTYMTNKEANNMHTVINGPYGMLNEMSAYCWGMNNSIGMYPYLKKNNRLAPFYSSCSNNKNAYAEFTYYILFYLDYAKTYDKSVYKGIMNNSQFKKVYKNTDKRFRANIKKYDNIAKKDKYFNYYPKANSNDYKILMKEISKSKYQKIYNQLMK